MSTVDHKNATGDLRDLIGTTVATHYEILGKLGQGSMGTVYEAVHKGLAKRVALKMLLSKHASDEQIIARLLREAKLTSSIGHEHIVEIIEFGTTSFGHDFVAMEYLEGQTLGAILEEECRLDSRRVVHIAKQIASALAAVHAKGIVHRDIKPENIFVESRAGFDFIKILDFGMSYALSPEKEVARLTQSGMVLGTPLYMSPEQARGEKDLDHRVDIYALGVILYESITGDVPFKVQNYLELLRQASSSTPRPPVEFVSNLDPALNALICKAISNEREDRHQSMEALISDLDALQLDATLSTSARICRTPRVSTRRQGKKRVYLPWLGFIIVLLIALMATIVLPMRADLRGRGDMQVRISPQQIEGRTHSQASTKTTAPPIRARIELGSNPSGATVWRGDTQVCASTPCEFRPANTDEAITLRVALGGYQDGRFLITPTLHNGKHLSLSLRPQD